MDNTIQIGPATYEIQRVFVGEQPITGLIADCLLRDKQRFVNLTENPVLQYNAGSGSAATKEVK